MSPSSLIATRTVHYLVPSAIHWTFVWRATAGPLAVRLRQQLPLVDHQRSNNGPPDKIICHSTTVPSASVYGNGRNCGKLLPALPSPFSPSLLSPLFSLLQFSLLLSHLLHLSTFFIILRLFLFFSSCSFSLFCSTFALFPYYLSLISLLILFFLLTTPSFLPARILFVTFFLSLLFYSILLLCFVFFSSLSLSIRTSFYSISILFLFIICLIFLVFYAFLYILLLYLSFLLSLLLFYLPLLPSPLSFAFFSHHSLF